MNRTEPRTMELDANAKLNAFLRVAGRRPDGYHELETLILPLALADRVRVTVTDDVTDASERFVMDDVSGPPEIVRALPTAGANLMVRAAEMFALRAGTGFGVRMSVAKRIPVEGGFGGGSADAAAVLLALDALVESGQSGEALSEIGATIGSDVPALLARGAVVASGRGERVERLGSASFRWLIARFAEGVRTADAFGWWDEDEKEVARPEEGAAVATDGRSAAARAATATGDVPALGSSLFNDLEGPVFRRRPDVAEAKRILLDGGLPGAIMCGSGASVAGLLPDGAGPRDLADLRRALERLTGVSPLTTESLVT